MRLIQRHRSRVQPGEFRHHEWNAPIFPTATALRPPGTSAWSPPSMSVSVQGLTLRLDSSQWWQELLLERCMFPVSLAAQVISVWTTFYRLSLNSIRGITTGAVTFIARVLELEPWIAQIRDSLDLKGRRQVLQSVHSRSHSILGRLRPLQSWMNS